jgi:ribose 5-phosphate isomerase B
MKIYFASDHAGFEMKNELLKFVGGLGYETEDCGAYELNQEDDYPEFIKKAAKAVSEKPDDAKAIILGGSGQGEAMVANKFPNVRAAVYFGCNCENDSSCQCGSCKCSLDTVKLSREHNDANVLSLGARFLSLDEAKDAVKQWLETPFSGEERHIRRITNIEI